MKHTLLFALLLAPLAALHAADQPAQPNRSASRPAVLLAKFTFDRSEVLDDWKLQDFKTGMEASVLEIDPVDPHSGIAALKFQVTSGAKRQGYVTSPVAIAGGKPAPGDSLRIRFFARTIAGKGQVDFRVLERGAKGVLGWLKFNNRQESIPIEPGGAWTEYAAEGTPRPETERVTLFVSFAETAPGGTVWIDDVSVEQITVGGAR